MENSRCYILKTNDGTELETCKKLVFFGHLSPGDDKNSARLTSFDFRIL